jgi:glycerophosphoryl diester phosphodiesterase
VTLGRRPLLIAHRGDPSRGPENTLSGVRLALEAEPDLIEVDVHLSADGHLMVIHDRTLDRTTSGSGDVATHTLGQLRKVDAGSWYSPAFAGEPIPTLAQAWEAVGDRSRLAVELKGEGTGAAVGRWARGLDSHIPTFLSFRTEELQGLKEQFPEAELRLLGAEPLSDSHTRAPFLSLADELGCTGVSVLGPECFADAVEKIHECGFEVWVWTVNEAAEWERLIRADVDAITTDRPLQFREFLVSRGLRPAED